MLMSFIFCIISNLNFLYFISRIPKWNPRFSVWFQNSGWPIYQQAGYIGCYLAVFSVGYYVLLWKFLILIWLHHWQFEQLPVVNNKIQYYSSNKMLQYLEVIPFSNTSNTFPILRCNSLPKVRWQRPVKNYLNHTWSHWSLASIHSHRPFQLYAVTSARGRLCSLPTLSLSLRRSFECRIEYLVLRSIYQTPIPSCSLQEWKLYSRPGAHWSQQPRETPWTERYMYIYTL